MKVLHIDGDEKNCHLDNLVLLIKHDRVGRNVGKAEAA
jgi:hypothetical protein